MASSDRSMPGMWHLLKRFAALPANRRGISIEAMVALAVARCLVLTVPIRWTVGRLERQTSGSPISAAAAEEIAREVGWAVRAAAAKTPWKSACLAQALAGKWMLGRRGLPGTIRLGVAKDVDGSLQAHAWLLIGERILTGGGTAARFTTIGDLE